MLLLRQPLLVELDLEANRITQEGARALGLALQHNKTLRLYVGTQPGAWVHEEGQWGGGEGCCICMEGSRCTWRTETCMWICLLRGVCRPAS